MFDSDLLTLIGAISGVISLIGIVWLAGIWKGCVDSDRAKWKEMHEKYPVAELWMMCKTLWDIYVVQVLHQIPDLTERKSPWTLKPKGRALIPDAIINTLDGIDALELCAEDIASGWLVAKHLGMEGISEMANTRNMSIQEAVAIMSLYLDERKSNDGSSPDEGGENAKRND